MNDEKTAVGAKNSVKLGSEEIDSPGVSGDDTTVMEEKPPNNNYWDTIPDEIAELILMEAIRSSSDVCKTYYGVIATCKIFNVLAKEKGRSYLPRMYSNETKIPPPPSSVI